MESLLSLLTMYWGKKKLSLELVLLHWQVVSDHLLGNCGCLSKLHLTTVGMTCVETYAWSLVPGSSITASIVRSYWLLRMQRRSYWPWSLPHKQVWMGKSMYDQQIFLPHKSRKGHWLISGLLCGFSAEDFKNSWKHVLNILQNSVCSSTVSSE